MVTLRKKERISYQLKKEEESDNDFTSDGTEDAYNSVHEDSEEEDDTEIASKITNLQRELHGSDTEPDDYEQYSVVSDEIMAHGNDMIVEMETVQLDEEVLEKINKLPALLDFLIHSLYIEYNGPRLIKTLKKGRQKKETKAEERAKYMEPFEVGKVLMMQKTDAGKIQCPIPGCEKDFKVLPSFKYHIANYGHDLKCMLLYGLENEFTRAQVEQFVSFENLDLFCRQVYQARYAKYEPLTNETEVQFYWPKDVRLQSCVFQFQGTEPDVFPGAPRKKRHEPKGNIDPMKFPPLPKPDFIKSPIFPEIPPQPFEALQDPNAYLPPIQNLECKEGSEAIEIPFLQGKKIRQTSFDYMLNVGGFSFMAEWVPSYEGILLYNYLDDLYIATGGQISSTNCQVGEYYKGPNNLQIWKISEGKDPELCFVLCHEFGNLIAMKWCPDSSIKDQRLGFLAASFSDGSCCVFSIPHPNLYPSTPVALHITTALFTFNSHLLATPQIDPENPNEEPKIEWICRIAWALGSHYVAFGTSFGKILIFSTHDILYNALTAHPICVAAPDPSPITEIDWHPVFECILIMSTLCGQVYILDIRHPEMPVKVQQYRGFMNEIKWSSYLTGFVQSHPDPAIKMTQQGEWSKSSRACVLNGTPLSLDSSHHHPFIATCTSAGEAVLCNVLVGTQRKVSNKPITTFHIRDVQFDDEQQQLKILFGRGALRQPKDYEDYLLMYHIRWHPIVNHSDIYSVCGRNGWIRIQKAFS